MRRNQVIYITALLVFISLLGLSQDGKLTQTEVKNILQDARRDFQLADYNSAFENYTLLLRNEPKNAQINYEAGVCLFEGSFDKSRSIPLFETSLENLEEKDELPELFYYMGRAYQYNNQYLFAIASYNTFLGFTKDNKKGKELTKEVEGLIDQCEKGKNQLKSGGASALTRVDKRFKDIRKFYTNGNQYVRLTNLGPSINSKYSEYGPLLLENGKFLLFTSRKEGSTGGEKYFDGQFFEDVYLSKKIDEFTYGQVQNLNEVERLDRSITNTSEHDATVSISPDGNTIFFYQDNIIEEIKFDGNQWKRQKSFKEVFEDPGSFVTSACLSKDNNTLFVVSDRDDAVGGRDIFVAEKNTDGSWSDLKNLGKSINTKKDESSPFLLNDSTLYFSSKGHNSIGGYDVFVSYKRNGEWLKPENLEIRINTSFDEINYVVTKEGDLAYYASNRDEGYGEFDIYFITKGEDEAIDPALIAQFKKAEKEAEDAGMLASEELAEVINQEQPEVDETTKGTDSNAIDSTQIAFVDDVNEQKKPTTSKPNDEISTKPSGSESKCKYNVGETKQKEPIKPIQSDEQSVYMVNDVMFAFNSTELNDVTKTKLDEVAQKLKENPNAYSEIIGHTDNVGSEEVNNRISRLRALKAYDYLLRKGISSDRLSYSYKGESEPIASNDTEKGRAQNRRIEINTIQAKLLENIVFGFDEKKVATSETEKLKEVIAFAKANPNEVIQLSGHTDPYGSKKYNLLLSQWRVESVERFLKDNGVKNQIKKQYFGEDKPRYPNNLYENRQMNRRVQVTVF